MRYLIICIEFLMLISLILIVIMISKYTSTDREEYKYLDNKLNNISIQLKELNKKFDNGLTITIE